MLEESGVAKIPVVRKGGNYGSITVKFTVTEVSATAGVDYAVSNNEVVIDDGEMEANINIDLIDDSLMEYAEQFTITIDSILGNIVNNSENDSYFSSVLGDIFFMTLFKKLLKVMMKC